jgi:hypothetical protein
MRTLEPIAPIRGGGSSSRMRNSPPSVSTFDAAHQRATNALANNIAQSKGMTYLQRLPEAILEGQFLVHNSVRPTHPSGRTVSARGCKRKISTLNPATVGGPPSWVRTIA